MIVVDTNIIVPLLIEAPATPLARKLWKRDRQWLVPVLWRSEFLNVLWLAVSSKVLREDSALDAWKRALRLFSTSERAVDGDHVLKTALKYGITAYDAHFVSLADKLGVKLVTNDKKSLSDKCPDALVVRLSSIVGT